MILIPAILVSLALAALALGLFSVGRSGQVDKINRRLGELRGHTDQLDVSIFRQERLSSIGAVSRLLSKLRSGLLRARGSWRPKGTYSQPGW